MKRKPTQFAFRKLIFLFTVLSLWSASMMAQTVSSYTFTQTAGTYTALGSGTTAIAGATDDAVGTLQPIGFSFVYHGTTYTQFAVGSNGYVQLGAASSTTAPSGVANTISILGRDGKTNGAVIYAVAGAVGSRILTVQFPSWYAQWNATTHTLNVQVKLYEGANTVQIVYGATAGNATAYAGTVGLIGASTADFATRTTSFAASTAGPANTTTMSFSSTNLPVSGRTYTWNPPVPTISSFSPSSGCGGASVVITGTLFTGATAVRFGGVAATSFVVNSATQITAICASTATGTVQVVTPSGTATSAGTFTINSTPVITTQPTTPPSFCGGGVANMTVIASGATTYEWRKGGVPIVADAVYSGESTSTLTITNPLLGDNGASITCVVGNGTPCTSTTTARTLSVGAAPPLPTATGTPLNICVGQSSLLNGVSAGNNINWYTVPTAGAAFSQVASGVDVSVTPGSSQTYYAESYTGASGTVTFNYTGSIVTWTVPPGVTSIVATVKGASGGYTSGGVAGLGASMTGTLSVTPGQMLSILAGQSPGLTTLYPAGGGGSFLALGASFATATPLIAAGGGGAAYTASGTGLGAPTTTSGTGTSPGTSGNGAPAGSCTGGGGGFFTSGGNDINYGFTGGAGFRQGGAGGAATATYAASYQVGGFGGGAPGNYVGSCNQFAGNGGGYSGGSAFGTATGYSGNAGGSFNSGTSQTNLAANNSGNGQVTISYVSLGCPSVSRVPVSINVGSYPVITVQPASPAPFCGGVGGTVTASVTATGATAYQWYKGGVLMTDDAVYTGTATNNINISSPSVSENGASLTCVVTGSTSSCTATTTAIVLNVSASPVAPTATGTPLNICVGQSSLLNGVSAGNNINWYTVPTAGAAFSQVASGVNVTVTPGSSQTYYAESYTGASGTVTFNYTGSIVNWTVPPGVTSIVATAKGAQGGSNGGTGGLGASVQGTLAVTPGQVLSILVGQQAPNSASFAGGGGGTFIANGAAYATATPLIVAGGGGGSVSGTGQAGQITNITTTGDGGGPVPGINGNGAASTSCGGGGGGFYTSGGSDVLTAPTFIATGGSGFRQGGAGGSGAGTYSNGGFGGGASPNYYGACNMEAGAGGGYSGGSGQNSGTFLTTGFGGGSYNTGTAQVNTSGTNSGNGQVTISYVSIGCPSPTRTPVAINVGTYPVITTQPNGLTPICGSGIVSTSITATGATAVQWYKGGVIMADDATYSGTSTNTLTITNPSISENGASFTCVLTGTGVCTVTSNAVALAVSNTPANPTGAAASPAAICIGQSSNLVAISAGNNIVWYDSLTGGSQVGASPSGIPLTVSPTTTRTYYAEANTGASAIVAFPYVSNAIQNWTVPAGVTSIDVQLWGAGGGSGAYATVATPSGGSGAYISGTLAVTPGQVLQLSIPSGGAYSTSVAGGAGGWPGGGQGGSDAIFSEYGGGGGGYAAIQIAGVTKVLAGAGGGGGAYFTGSNYGGGGGATTGGDGAIGGNTGAAGGGTISAGGAGGAGTTPAGGAGTAFTGGIGAVVSGLYGPGGGGAGYYGGGGGAGNGGGGGGGSSYPASSGGGFTITSNLAGTINSLNAVAIAPGAGKPAGVGDGAFHTAGGNGYIIISYNSPGCPSASRVPVTVTVNPLPVVAITPTVTNYCIPGGPGVGLTASGAATYSWSTGSALNPITVTPVSATVYTVTGTSTFGCTASTTQSISVSNSPTATATASPTPICAGSPISLTSVGATAPISGNYSVTSIPFAPVSGTPIAGPAGDDVVSAAIPIGFGFPFYGTSYTNVYIGTNGFITFDNSGLSGCCSGLTLPTPSSGVNPTNLIATCWTDLNTGSGGTIDYFNLTSPNRFVVRYNGVAHYLGTPQVTSQIIIYQTGIVEIHNTSINSQGIMTQGVENSAGTLGTPISGRNAVGFTATNDAYRFSPPTVAITGYSWSGPNTFTAATQNATATAGPASGAYTVTVTDANGCTVSASTVSVTVNLPSTAATSVSSTSSSICAGTPITLTQAGGTIGTSAVWKWYTDASYATLVGTSAAANASLTISPTASATYYVRAENTAGPCAANVGDTTVSVAVSVTTPSVAATAVIAAPTPICAGDTVTLTQTGGSLGTGAIWSWYTDNTYSTFIGNSSSTSALLRVAQLVYTTYWVRAEGTASPCPLNVGNIAIHGTVIVNPPGSGGCVAPPRNNNICYPTNVTPRITTTTPYTAAGYANINTHADTVYDVNTLATFQVGSEPIGSCGSAGITNKTLWYKFTAPFCATPTVHISTDDRSTTNFNTRISVYRRLAPYTCSSPFIEVACNDDANYYLNSGATTSSSVILTPNSSTPGANQYAPGEDLYIQASGTAANFGNYGLIIDLEPLVPTASSVGSGSAVINWNAAMTSPWGGVSGTYVQWRVAGSGPTVGGTYRYVSGPLGTTTITGLLPSTTYEFWASYVCGNGGRWWSKKSSFTTSATCTGGISPDIVSIVAGSPCNRPVITFNATSLPYSSYRVVRKDTGSSVVLVSGAYYTSPSPQTFVAAPLTFGRTYQFYVLAYCGTSRVDSSAMVTYTACASLRMANPNPTQETTIDDKNVAYILPNGDVVYGVPFNAIDLPIDVNNPNAQELSIRTMDAATYYGRSNNEEIVVSADGDLVIYPNPAHTEATVGYSFAKESTTMSIQVLDAQGKEIMSDQISNPGMSGEYKINLNKFTAGVYFVKVQAGDYLQTRKLVVETR